MRQHCPLLLAAIFLSLLLSVRADTAGSDELTPAEALYEAGVELYLDGRVGAAEAYFRIVELQAEDEELRQLARIGLLGCHARANDRPEGLNVVKRLQEGPSTREQKATWQRYAQRLNIPVQRWSIAPVLSAYFDSNVDLAPDERTFPYLTDSGIVELTLDPDALEIESMVYTGGLTARYALKEENSHTQNLIAQASVSHIEALAENRAGGFFGFSDFRRLSGDHALRTVASTYLSEIKEDEVALFAVRADLFSRLGRGRLNLNLQWGEYRFDQNRASDGRLIGVGGLWTAPPRGAWTFGIGSQFDRYLADSEFASYISGRLRVECSYKVNADLDLQVGLSYLVRDFDGLQEGFGDDRRDTSYPLELVANYRVGYINGQSLFLKLKGSYEEVHSDHALFERKRLVVGSELAIEF